MSGVDLMATSVKNSRVSVQAEQEHGSLLCQLCEMIQWYKTLFNRNQNDGLGTKKICIYRETYLVHDVQVL